MKGVAVALLLVTVAALFVAYNSSFKVLSAKRQARDFRTQVDQLTKETKELKASLEDVKEKYSREIIARQNLEATIGQQKATISEFAEKLQRQATLSQPQIKNFQHSPRAPVLSGAKTAQLGKDTPDDAQVSAKKTPSTNFIPSSTKTQ